MLMLASNPLLRAGALLLLPLALADCAGTRGGSIPYGVKNFGVPDAPRATQMIEGYRISTLDVLTVSVFQVQDLTHDYQVDMSGNIAMPLLGTVPAVGKTTTELKTLIADRLNAKYLRNADVTVAVKESVGRSVTVEGSVKSPGIFATPGNMTLLQAIASAGGADPNSNEHRVAVFRQIDGQRMAAAFDLVRIRHGEEPDPEVYPGDIVVVGGNKIPSIYRDLLQTLPLVALFRPF